MKACVLIFSIGFLCLTMLTLSCSRGKNPIEPEQNFNDFSTTILEANNHSIIAVYDMTINTANQTFTYETTKRNINYHFPLTQWYPNVLEVVDYGFTPNFWAEIKLTHPLPGTGHDAFDPRVIAILPATPGNRFHYPVFNAIGNNKVLLNYDDYTKLYDNLGGNIPGNTNPYKAYFKDEAYRRWSSIDPISETQRWEMNIDGFGGPLVFKLVVDISTSYPQYPEPPIHNAPEPVQIDAQVGNDLHYLGGSTLVTVTLKDWQGGENIKCKVEAPDLFTGASELIYKCPAPDFKEHVFEGTISNELRAQAGEYRILISAWDIPTDIHVFDEAVAIVNGDIVFNPVEVTPPGLNFYPWDIFVSGNYAFVAGNDTGLHIFDISNPSEPVWINAVSLPGTAYRVHVCDDYAYVASGFKGLHIVKINPVNSAYLVKTVDTSGISEDVCVVGEYAYIADGSPGLQIIDVSPPESASVVRTIDTAYSAIAVDCDGEYACVADKSGGLVIIDVNPINSATIVKIIYTGWAMSVKMQNGYAFVGDTLSADNLFIIDIEPVNSAYIVKAIPVGGLIWDLFLSNGYAYLSCDDAGLQIVDIDPIDSATLINTIETPKITNSIHVANDYAYTVLNTCGFQIVYVNPPESAYVVKTMESPKDPCSLFADGDYLFSSDLYVGLRILDINPPESANMVKTVYTPGQSYRFHVVNDRVYLADGDKSIQVIDIDPPQQAEIIKTIHTTYGYKVAVYARDGYAYATNSGEFFTQFHVIDIDPLDSAYLVKSVNLSERGTCIDLYNNFAFVSSYSYFDILDISVPELTHIEKTIDLPGYVADVVVSNGYAYLANERHGLRIIDIDPPDAAFIEKTIDTPGTAWDVFLYRGYAFVADGESGFQIVDIEPLDTAHIVASCPTKGPTDEMCVQDNYAYLACSTYGIGIVKLY